MAPEQLKGEEVDARSDLFSLGAVIFEMLTGRPAFAGKTVSEVRAAVLEREPPAVSSLEVAVPGAVDAIVRRCLAKNKNERTSSASDVMRALTSLLYLAYKPGPDLAVGRRHHCCDRDRS